CMSSNTQVRSQSSLLESSRGHEIPIRSTHRLGCAHGHSGFRLWVVSLVYRGRRFFAADGRWNCPVRRYFFQPKLHMVSAPSPAVLLEPSSAAGRPSRAGCKMKRTVRAEITKSAPGTEGDTEPAKNELPHEGQSAAERAQDARAVGGDADLRPHPPGPGRGAEVPAARWAAICQRPHPPRTRS